MTFAELVERAKRQCVWPEGEFNLAACVNQAKSIVAVAVMGDDARRGLLQQNYSITLSAAGVGDLLTATGAIPGELFFEGIDWGAVVDGDGNILQPLTHYHDFIRPQDINYAYYCKVNRSIHTRAKDIPVFLPSDIASVTGPITITASFEPESVDDFPSELEPDLVTALCSAVTPLTNANAGPA